MAIVLVQSVSLQTGAVNNTTLAFGSNLGAGNLLIVAQQHYDSGQAAITMPTDTRGHTYQTAVTQIMDFTGDGTVMGSFYAENTSAGANTVTFDIAGTTPDGLGCMISEFSGMATSGALDKTAVAENIPGSTAVLSAATATTSQADELLFGMMTYDPGGSTMNEASPGGYSLIQEIEAVPFNCEYKVVSSTGAYQSSWTLGASFRWMCHIATYKAAVSVTGVLTGTAIAGGVTEAQLVAGAETVILTLTGDTWIPS